MALVSMGVFAGYALGSRSPGTPSVIGANLCENMSRVGAWGQRLLSMPCPSGEASDASTRSVTDDQIALGVESDEVVEEGPLDLEEPPADIAVEDWGDQTQAESKDPDTTGRYLDVDLSAQYAVLYDERSNALWESPIVSGDTTTGFTTPAGTFTIYDKELCQELVGLDYDGDGYPDYDNYVSYWMPFSGGLGLHDASWRDNFGGDIYSYDGSHGCVNLPSDAAAALFDMVNVGETVVIHW